MHEYIGFTVFEINTSLLYYLLSEHNAFNILRNLLILVDDTITKLFPKL